MRRDWQEERRLTLEDGQELELDYWFLTDLTCWGESYGLAVTDSNGKEEIFRHITTRREEAELLLRHMAAGTVTPVTASDIVEDFLAR